MKYVYAALLLHTSGQDVNEKNLMKVLKAAGKDVEEARVKSLVAALSEVDIDQALKAAPGLVVAQPSVTPKEPETEEKKEEEKEEKEEEAMAGLGALFG